MKKIWIMGKTYDLSDPKEVEKDVTDRLRDYTHISHLNFDLTNSPNKVVMTWYREMLPEYDMRDGLLYESDILMMTGNGYEGFQPKYDCSGFAHFPNIINLIPTEDFISSYIKNSKYYGATKPKKVEVEETRTYLTVRLEYSGGGKVQNNSKT